MNRFLYNSLTWKSFLSSVTKDIKEHDGIFSWKIQGRDQIVFNRPVSSNDLEYLKTFDKFSTFYLSGEDILVLEKDFKISKQRDNDVIIPIENFNLSGNKYIKIRTAINRNNRINFTILDDFRKYEDILECLQRWDDTCGEKHFQVRTGKNRYFFKNGYHREGISLFIYYNDKLVGFGVLSLPNSDGCSTYIIGKTLCYDYKGLSEYTDIKLYEKARNMGVKMINLGGGKDSVVEYKMKFPNAYTIESFDVKCIKKS